MKDRVDLLRSFQIDHGVSEEYARRTLRPDLYATFQLSEETVRFAGLGFPEEGLWDNVKIHSLRIVDRIDQLPIPDDLKTRAKKGGLVHDIPETEMLQRAKREGERITDVTATAKAEDKSLDSRTDFDEDRVAREILTSDEYELYSEVANASGFLKGNEDSATPSATGLIVKMCDKIDSDLTFHLLARENRQNVPELSVKGQSLAFDQYSAYLERLKLLEGSEVSEASILCQKLLSRCIETIREIWSEVPTEEIPAVILQNLGF